MLVVARYVYCPSIYISIIGNRMVQRLEAGVWQPGKDISKFKGEQRLQCHLPLAAQSDDSPITLLISLLLDLGAERDGAHDTITKLFVQDGLVGVAIVLYNLEQSVYQRLFWWHLHLATTVWESRQLDLETFLWHFKKLGKLFDVLRRGLSLAIEQSGYGDLRSTEVLGNGLEGEVLLGFGFEKGHIRGWKTR